MVAFFKGALTTWAHFTSEFTLGGVLDEATDLQKDLAWIPPTNDLNEGMLGSYHQFIRTRPQTSLHKFNSQVMYVSAMSLE